MIYLLIIFLEIVLLFLLSKIVPTLITQIFYFFIRSQKVAIFILCIIFFPGTLVHEMAHLLMAGMLLVPVGGINLIPKIEEGGVKLGHVAIAKTDPIRRALIGFAPIFAGLAILSGMIFYAYSQFFHYSIYPIWLVTILIYLSLVIGNTMFSSKKDMEGSLGIFAVLIGLIGALYLLGFNGVFIFIKEKLFDSHITFYQTLAYLLAIPVILDILLYLLAKFLHRKLY